ncbi:MAG TPA: pilus assembly protein N-terminal domain-containing protein [Bryobacteraceae bacterium]|nr:pilus assembly protein N-terminal domain-containing protein [Bryobacteraceae bacterium]
MKALFPISKRALVDILLAAGLVASASALRAAQTAPAVTPAEQITVGSGKTFLLDTPVNIERVSVAAPAAAEAVPVSARSLMINGKSPGETSLVIWLSDGSRREYDLRVTANSARVDAAKDQMKREFGSDVQITVENGTVYLTGRLKDLFEANRAVDIAATLGKVVNLLKVDVPPQEQQILLKVRFADVDRSKTLDLGINFFGTPSGFPFTATTGTYSPTRIGSLDTSAAGGAANTTFSLSDTLNLLLVDPHLNVGATLKALATKNVLQILAEPNLLAMNGKEASFVAGGEFPFPNLQGGGGGVGQVTVSFREFGIRIHFLPTITPRGTIRLHVTPEVSSLDFANSLSIEGSTIPALNTRRVDTEIELQSGQSFAIAGLLDNRTTESLSRIPGLGDIPLFGKLFTTRATNKSNSELLVIVTPELVQPIPQGESLPDLPRPTSFLEGPGVLTQSPRTPGTDQTGPGPARNARTEIPVQELEQLQKARTASAPQAPLPATPSFNPAFTQPTAAGGAEPGGVTGGSGTQ